MPRDRLIYRGYYPGTTVAILEVLPFNAQLMQMTIAVTDGPYPDIGDNFVLTKISGKDSRLTIDLRTMPAAGIDVWPCLDHWEFLKGDSVQFSFGNTDNKVVGVELIFREAV